MKVQFIFDYRSIYAYLSNSQIKTLGATIDYQLVDIVTIMNKVNNQPSPKCPPKAKYSIMDAMRWAQLYNVRLSPNEDLLLGMKEGRLENALLSRVGLAAQRMGIFDEVNDALFGAVWAGSDDLLSEKGRHRFAMEHGIPASLWGVAESPEVFSDLAANDERAIANGVFGAPTFYVGDEMFFGNDRLVFVKERLKSMASGVEL